jgi:hypothetical protein
MDNLTCNKILFTEIIIYCLSGISIIEINVIIRTYLFYMWFCVLSWQIYFKTKLKENWCNILSQRKGDFCVISTCVSYQAAFIHKLSTRLNNALLCVWNKLCRLSCFHLKFMFENFMEVEILLCIHYYCYFCDKLFHILYKILVSPFYRSNNLFFFWDIMCL